MTSLDDATVNADASSATSAADAPPADAGDTPGLPPAGVAGPVPAGSDEPGEPAPGAAARPAGRARERAPRGGPDAVCAAAVDLAREAALEEAEPGTVGDHLGVLAEGERLVTHSFASLARGYHGWRWAVTVARAPRSKHVTVCEVVLLPDRDAVLAPTWVPWSDRLAPGDLGATDALPYRADDPYLEPGYALTGEEDEDRLAVWELGLGRPRVLSLEGRDAAASRWYAGDRGPTSEEALHASAACATCGYFLPLAGSLRRAFGVCGNEWSPSDAKVVSVDHGCGAHSETDVEAPEPIPLPEPILDETGAEAVTLIPHRAPEAPEVQQAAEAAAVGELAAQQQAEAAEALADPVEVLADPVAELAGEPADPVGEPAEGLHGGTDGGTDGGSDGGPAPDPRP